ncbi:hypothetical protein Acr_11g0017010 [Actinidia rufa]|uniref:BAG domain-containing protein n=1 Tax=Actinidia rufa TaxID=165716 RepID=A0A7J0FFF1_9ERIC|nr:hypothetical protein Acr_11g0017010 [Actinidia rufa]
MHPINRCMDSFPHHRNQMPYTHPYYPSFEAIPPQMKVDASRSPVTYGTWPYESHFGHSYFPVGCHGCCNHSYFPGYCGNQPSCPHYLSPPSPFHHHGGYPSLPETYPVHYLPPPHYLMDQPRSKYDNNMGKDHHCCGCPNHSCNKIEDRHVKIEEQEPAFGNKSCNSLVPVELKNQPYPVVYLPPDYVKREQRNLAQPELKERDEYPHDTRAHENQKSSERVWNGWFPFDVNDFGLLNHGADRKGTQNQQNEAKNQFSYPVYLMPYKPQEEEKRGHKKASDCKEGNTGWVSSEKSPFDLKATSHLPSSEEKSGGEVCPKTMDMKYDNQMIIPLEQLEEPEETMMEEEAEAKSRGITMKDKDDSKEKQPPNNGTKRRSSSPPKTSKLPPVCLRVDPLPKRKNCVERSKTTSPHRKASTQHDMQSSSCTANKTNEVERNEKERKVVEVTESYGDDFKIQGQPEVPLSLPIDTRENVSVDDVRNVKEDKEAGHIKEEKAGGVIKSEDATITSQSADSQSLAGEVKKSKRKNLSEVEAAMIIQSAYRGFDVRRWEPLKKMKQIAEVREHVGEVRSCVEALESSPRNGNDNKQMAVIGETIMSLLLKLDTIQELHPSIRDFRKSVVKQLVSLQEKLDSLANKKSVVSTAKLVEDLCSQGEQKEAEVGQKTSVGEINNHNNFGSQAMETSGRKLDEKEVCDEPEDKTTAASIGSGVESGQAEAEAVNKLKDGLNDEVIDDGQAMMLMTGVEDQEVKLPVEEPRPMDAEENVDLANEVTLPSCPDDHVEFLRVSGEVLAVEESQRNERIETGESEVLQGGGVESHLSTNLTSMDGEETYQGQQPLDALKEEQVSVDLVDETGGERDSDLDEETGVKQAELSSKTQGEEFGRIIDHVETSQQEQDSGMNNNYDRSWTEKEAPMEETKECSNMESEIMIEENAELVEHGHEAEAGTEQDEGEGKLFLLSPTVRKVSVRSDTRSESDWKNLSEVEAAMIIQSAYRGFDARRWEPLKKMKQIAEVRKHVGELRSRVEALELSPRNGNDNKQMDVIGETIMSLLLKLDTIQELHPSIRDLRKSVVKQLVSLQEKLDSLATKKSVVSTAKLVEDLPVDTGEYACSQGEQKEAEFGQKKSVGEINNHNNFGSQAMETSDRKLDEKEVCDDPEDKTTAASIGSGVESDQAEAEAVNKLKDGSIDDGQAMMLKTGVEDQEVKLPVEPRPMDAEENVDLANEVTLPSCPDDHVEFPRVSGEVFAVEEPQSNERIETGESEVLQGVGVESLLSTNLTSMDGEETYQGQQPLDALKEEQVSVDKVDETEGERGSDLDEETGVKQAELSSKTQGEEFGRIIDHVETSQLELLPVENEIHGAGQKQDSGMNNDYDRSWTEKEVPIKETKECSNMESEEEENAELVEHGHEAEAGTERDKSEGEIFLVSPTVRKGSVRSDVRSESNWNLLEENEKLRELMEKLIEAGIEQLTAISNLSVRVNNLEEKLARKRKVRTRRVRVGSSCVKAPNDSLKGMAHGVAV